MTSSEWGGCSRVSLLTVCVDATVLLLLAPELPALLLVALQLFLEGVGHNFRQVSVHD